MLLARAESAAGHVLAVANLHGSVSEVRAAGDQVIDAAAQAVDFAGELPLLFGGDLNLRPATHPDVFGSLDQTFSVSRRLHLRHAAIWGSLSVPIGLYPAGSRYRANDACALMWVHATLVCTENYVRTYW